MKHRALLVEDEELSRHRLRRLLEAHPEVEVVGEAGSGPEALEQIARHRPGLLFLDIDLPEFNGFEVLKRAGASPLVIFTTGHDQYALQAFEAAGIDYLLKPIEAATLERAMGKLERLAVQGNAELDRRFAELLKHWRPPVEPQYVQKMAVRLGERAILIELRDVSHFDARDKYVFMHTTGGKEYIVDHTIAELEAQLDPRRFVRVHRSTVLNVDHVKEIHDWFGGKYRVILDDKAASEVVVSKGMAANLKAIVPF
jgi:two-component system, LytTR family, response regulator